MDAALVGKGGQAHVGGVIIRGQVGHFADKAAGGGELGEAIARNAVVAQLKLQVGDQGAEVGVAAALPIAVDRALHHACAFADGGDRIGVSRPGVIVGVDPQGGIGVARPCQIRPGGLHHLRNFVGQGAAIGITKHQPFRPRFSGRAEGGDRIVAVAPIAIKPMFRVVDHPSPLAAQVGDRIANHRQVFIQGGVQPLGDVQIPGLAKNRDPACPRRQNRLQQRILGSDGAGATGGTKGHNFRLFQWFLAQLPEKLHILGIGSGPATFNEGNPEAIELASNPQFVFEGEGQSFSLCPVAQGGVVEPQGWGHGI